MEGTQAAIVLAAGRSSRMGEHKLLLSLHGRPLVTYAVEAACGSRAEPVIVVLGHHAEQVAAALPVGRFHVVTNTAFQDGMATSLRAGLHALPTSVTGTLVMLADQPFIATALVNSIFATASAHPEHIVAVSFSGQRGTPVYFPHSLFGELAGITGDEGGRSVIARHGERVQLVEVTDATVGLDVDRPSDYERLTSLWPGYSENEHG